MANYRGGRINEEVKREISIIIRDEIKDPRMTAMVSITSVKVSKDLRYAKVFVSIFGKNEEEKNETFAALKSASGYVRREVGQRMNLRNTPQIIFELDDSISYSMRIEELIDKVKDK
ncbi:MULTISPECIES: 30S ribosome-binding factor RbfA [unclassified Clostridium]|jgi:ribosome-binding factor A|uniref:30S ribosome-binding factor RbfA n=1 Tax=unclassified Clostridium TaxID=2614128 RepID=UPI0025B9FC70|nr:30S ribosome-binding factor RbfA [Clostridium sp.]MCI6692794.1 30S ribosome-binding factor RbfA [Clostridium sp.]MDY2631988.1 30S ribosome-binding factor RbfA [Clostridium sp.]MDY4250929.1 30S ribosome-binding factor RbfA [Clostridium sp.]MDY6227047.1 30S ribosome-binding factor RbfA [Clostridium sp.]